VTTMKMTNWHCHWMVKIMLPQVALTSNGQMCCTADLVLDSVQYQSRHSQKSSNSFSDAPSIVSRETLCLNHSTSVSMSSLTISSALQLIQQPTTTSTTYVRRLRRDVTLKQECVRIVSLFFFHPCEILSSSLGQCSHRPVLNQDEEDCQRHCQTQV